MVTLCCSEEAHPAKLRSLLGQVMTDFMRAAVLAEASSAEMRRLQHPALAVARRGSLWHVHLLGRSWLVPQGGEWWSRWQSQQLIKSNSLTGA